MPQAHHRPVRSFVRRSARMTPAQRVAIVRCWPIYGLEGAGLLDLDAVFGRRVPRVMEIGFGNGEALVSLAESHPECDYLGVDVYEPGIGRLLAAVAEKRLDNVRLLRGDAVDVLPKRLAPASLNAMLLFFPDPWPKKRHHKRRLVQTDFVKLVASRLVPGGHFHLATDWQDYAEHMLTVLEEEDAFVNLAGPGNFCTRGTDRPMTKFERRGRRLGHEVLDLLFERRGPS
ncbi:MAG: tRNA (guanosine(46)-N7)-methyltransferase TrmB [Gammaproteobacteria bacterium]|nr:MAG: tRNA (guanosine(46)-N7)-methyltransferase TrmB [Chloroflexota bacterium]TDJ18515.1 MAG: tRNA (guanosine(46)-N7)-methyltransferase TrmB [Gammaproteobacteria bacterium]